MVKRFWQRLLQWIQPILPPFLKKRRSRRVQLQCLSEENQGDLGEEDTSANAESNAAETWFNQGKQQFAAKDFLGAIASFDQAIQLKPAYHEAWNNRGLALGNLGDYEGAIASYEKAIQIKPDYQLAWYNWGVALDKLKYKT